MSQVTFVTESGIPYHEAFLMSDRFIHLNMWTKGIWYVDTHHPQWELMKNAAMEVAVQFGDQETIDKLNNVKPCSE